MLASRTAVSALTLVAGLAAWSYSAPSQAYPLNPWGVQTAQGSYVLNPFLYFYNKGKGVYPIVYGATGLGERMDVIAGVGGWTWLSGGLDGGLDGLEVMPRYFFNESMGVTVHLIYGLPGSSTYVENQLTVAPEFHGVFGGDSLALTVNAGWRPTLGGGAGFQPGAVVAYLAPEYNFSSQFSLFLEIDPSFTLGEGGGLGMLLVPGVGFALDPDQTHTFSVGVQVDPLSDSGGDFLENNVSLGVWYATAFGG